MHSLLSLHAPARAATTDPLREVLMLQFLSLPVFQVRSRGRGRVGDPNTNPNPNPDPDPSSNANQDPAPWNVVWRAGELFPIDVGDGDPNPDPNPNPNPHPNPHPNQVRAFGPQSGKLLYVINDAHKLIGVGEPTP